MIDIFDLDGKELDEALDFAWKRSRKDAIKRMKACKTPKEYMELRERDSIAFLAAQRISTEIVNKLHKDKR